jgi:signal transduction histidine kinase
VIQILFNLATNAVEAIAETGGRVVLRARRQPGGDVDVEVADTGPGIDPAVLPRIWDPFYTTKAEGTGLGLSIVRALVEEQPGATIAVESVPGVGTTFRLTMLTAATIDAEMSARVTSGG